MKQTVTFELKGHDLFIDAIKAYAIIWVLIGHFLTSSNAILYPIWGGVQVPLFITIQCFHFFKKDKPELKLGRIITRVLLPFVYVQLFIVVLLYALNGFTDLWSILDYFPKHGGYGQGDYFPIVYFQIALLLPVFWGLTKRIGNNKWTLLLCYLVICEGLEILCSLIHIPDSVYRYLAIRYVFLLFFGWKWAKEGITMDLTTCIMSLLSLISIIYFEFFKGACEPLFLDTVWTYHRWPCYFFMAELLVFILSQIWQWLSKSKNVVSTVLFFAKYSYDIFLAQMVAYVLFPYEVFCFMPRITAILSRFLVATAFSLVFGWLIHLILKNIKYINTN